MRKPWLALLALVLAGCLVPHYEANEADVPNSAGASGSSNLAGSSGASAAGSGSAGCQTGQKSCAGNCVAIDDVEYGCSESSCNKSACPAAGTATLTCQDGACVIGSCSAGSKLCDGRCVAVNDPTFGCTESGCDASSCPNPGDSTLICSGKACVVGACTSETKQCGKNCVPPDTNHGCGDSADCDACASNEVCSGAPSVCTCVGDDEEACKGIACGEVTNNCESPVECADTCVSPAFCGSGPEVNQCICDTGAACGKVKCGKITTACGQELECTSFCMGDKPYCLGNDCVQCTDKSQCDAGGNPCVVPDCIDQKCVYAPAGNATTCNLGKCSKLVPGLCVRSQINAGGVSIDPVEVTRGDYYAFMVAKGEDVSGQPSYCSWNTSYEAELDYPIPWADYDLPVTGVDWCDAYMFCKWSSRKLCGKIGTGTNDWDDYVDANLSQWHHACGGASDTAYPYGNSFDKAKCNSAPDSLGLEPVGSYPGCVGGYAGLYDMSGNAGEWEDACDPVVNEGSEQCRVRGGYYHTPFQNDAESVLCQQGDLRQRSYRSFDLSFRCCGN